MWWTMMFSMSSVLIDVKRMWITFYSLLNFPNAIEMKLDLLG
jgi:hypothetical protein